jgi:mannose-6-phosphate isomerase-like protein (cupin superfamily)
MIERVRTAEQPPEPRPDSQYDVILRRRNEFVERQNSGRLVIRKEDIRWDVNRQGKHGFMLHTYLFDDRCLEDWWVFIHDIQGVSGRHRHQGGLVLFILEGSGYSTMNGVRYDWKKGDCLLMPLLPEGVDHQHFNPTPDKPALWLAFIHKTMFDEVGSELTQTQDSQSWLAGQGR